MASVEKRVRDGKVTWLARWRDPSGRQKKQTIRCKSDAERFLTSVDHAQLIGAYVSPEAGRSRSESGPRGGWLRRGTSSLPPEPGTKAS